MNTLLSLIYTRRAVLGQTALAALLFAVPSCAAPNATTIAATAPGAVQTRANEQVAPTQIKTKFADNRVAVGYLTFSKWDKYGPDDIDYKDLTHIIPSFVVPKSPTDPTVVFNGKAENFAQYPDLKEPTFAGYIEKLVPKAHANDVKVLLGVNSQTGDNAGDLAKIFADDKMRAQFIENVLKMAKQHDMDGVDLDYEYALTPAAGAGVVKFMADVRAAIDADADLSKRGFLLTMANGNSKWANRFYDFASLNKSCDWFNVMSYSYAAKWSKQSGHNTPLFADTIARGKDINASIDESVKTFRDEFKVPASKIVVGLAFYGWKFDGTTLYGEKKDAIDLKYRDVVQDYIGKPDWKYNWSESAKVPYLTNEKTKSIISYDDERAIAAKVDYVKEHDLRGVMIWEISRGYLPGQTQTQPLLATIGKVLGAKS